MLKEIERKPPSRWNWILWWRVDQDDVDWQATHYHDMGLLEPYKNLAALALLFSAALTSASAMITDNMMILADAAIGASLAAFIYFGHRWAMIGAMAWWTLAKIMTVVSNAFYIVVALAWWGLYMHAFYMAYLVEKRRRQPVAEASAFD